jgi:hypothetical protein
VRARENVDSALLVLNKARFDGVMQHYPEHNDIIMTNLLYQYGLIREGSDTGHARAGGSDEESYAQLRSAIKVCSAWRKNCQHSTPNLWQP